MDRFDISELIQKTPYGEFDYTFLSDVLRRYSKPRNIITRLLKEKQIVRVKKGIYVYGKNSLGPNYSKKILANMIYGPSYISLEYALGYYGFVPERVETLTNMTNKKNKSYQTPLGEFTYQFLPTKYFVLGVERVSIDQDRTVLMASKEKCIVDLLYQQKKMVLETDVERFLFDDMRINSHELQQLHVPKLRSICKQYTQKSYRHLENIIKKVTL